MIFSSIIFLFFYIIFVFIFYYLSPQKSKNFILLLCSLFFYAWGEPVYVVLMIFSVIFNYLVALDIAESDGKIKKRSWNLFFGISVDLLLLFYFKYTNFFFSIFHLPGVNVTLPLGISFYTFQTISYLVDVYKKEVKPQKSFLDFALYVTMFPQLIAGPIVRYRDIEPSLKHRKISFVRMGYGANFFLRGLAKKVLLANNIGELASKIMALNTGNRSMATAWLGAIAYTLQIYFDFSGYSDMAIGLGEMFGFSFKKNFDYPYLSTSITEFWRRWHISLGQWFKEYVYIPLGGNRKGRAKQIRNILIVWMLTGLWHGAGWNFILWGLYYGILLIIEKIFLGKYLEKLPRLLQHVYTMFLIVIGWVLFMSDGLSMVGSYLYSMFGNVSNMCDSAFLYYLCSYGFILLAGILCCGKFVPRLFALLMENRPVFAAAVKMVLFFFILCNLVYDSYNPFLYFRF